MRNIEEIAAEEEARDSEVRRSRLKKMFLVLGSCLALWGWILFNRGEMGKGALLIIASVVCWGLGWGMLKIFRGSVGTFLLSLLPAFFGFGLYFFTRLPSFYWGKDPAFWWSVHAGAVNEPSWSPLSYLLGEAVCYLWPSYQYSILPALSSVVLALALFFLVGEYFLQFKNKNLLNGFFSILASLTVAVSSPFWSAGTLALGLTASMGLLLFLYQRSLSGLEERPWKTLAFLIGLLCCVHPLWGLMGFLNYQGFADKKGKSLRNILPFAAGLTPALWVVFRAGRVFPSWGGDHPFLEMFKTWDRLWRPTGAVLSSGFLALGWTTALLSLLVVLLWGLNFFKWKASGKIHFPVLDFWIWQSSGLMGVLFYSSSSETLGPTALWFVAGLGMMLLKPLEKGVEKRQVTFFSGAPLAWMAAVGLLVAFGLSWLPGQELGRRQPYFPQQYAMNLLETLHQKSILICRDPFDAAACREARLMEPVAMDSIILDEQYLNQRWYVAQVIHQASEILFSNISLPAEQVVKSIALTNSDLWDVQWDVSDLPPDFKGLKTAPTILTQEFLGTAVPANPESTQYRYDLTALSEAGKAMGQTSFYFSRYVTGFNELGKYLMSQARYSGAIHAFERALKLNPSYQEPQTWLDQMYSKQNILEAARLEFEKTVKDHPQKIKVVLSQLEQAQKSNDEAGEVTILDQMIRLNSELADAEYQLSKIYSEEGRDQESKALLESSVNLNPKQLEAQMTLGQLMARLGNRIKAEGAFRAVLEIDPQNKKAQVELWKLLNKP